MPRQNWVSELESWRAALAAKGAVFTKFDIGPPASSEEVSSVVRASGRPLPADMATALATVAGRANFFWNLWDLREGPTVSRELQRFGQTGELEFNVKTLTWLRAEGEELHEDIREIGEEGAALIRASIQFQLLSTGDILAVDSRTGTVNYLHYDSGFGRGVALAPSFSEFLARFAHIGCVGPELWVLESVLGQDGIDVSAPLATLWREWAGVGSSNGRGKPS